MVQPINPAVLNQLMNPYSQPLQQLSQTAQNISGQRMQQQQIDMQKADQQRQAEQQKLATAVQMAPAMVRFLGEAQNLPPEQRPSFFLQNQDILKPLGMDLSQASPDDFTNPTLQKHQKMFSSLIQQQGPSSGLGKLIQERNQLMSANPNDPNVQAYDSAIQQESSSDPSMTAYQKESLDIQRQRLASEKTKMTQQSAGVQDFQYYQNLKKADPVSAEQFGRERGYISNEGRELSVYLQKRLSESTDTAVTSENNASRYNLLSSDIEKAGISGGLLGGSWAEKLKDISGNQNEITDLRQRYMGIRASQVIKNLPPGAASDADVALSLSGFPSDNANGAQIASFLRGVAKLEQYNAEFNNFKANYIADKGHERNLLKAWESSQPKEMAAQPAQQQTQPAQPQPNQVLKFDNQGNLIQ